MKKRDFCVILLILTITLCCGCSGSRGLKKDYVLKEGTKPSYEMVPIKVNNTTPYDELITKKVDIHIFAQKFSFVVYPWGAHMSRIAEEVGLECVRETKEGALYSVHKVKQGGLLYIFYNNEFGRENNDDRLVRRWFYVRENLSYSDFEKVIEEKGIMSDVIKVDETEQIFDNIHSGEWIGEDKMSEIVTWHYLSDGILELEYVKQGDVYVLRDHVWKSNFDLEDWQAAVVEPYNAKILEIDRIK